MSVQTNNKTIQNKPGIHEWGILCHRKCSNRSACQSCVGVMTTPPQKEIPLSEHGTRTTQYIWGSMYGKAIYYDSKHQEIRKTKRKGAFSFDVTRPKGTKVAGITSNKFRSAPRWVEGETIKIRLNLGEGNKKNIGEKKKKTMEFFKGEKSFGEIEFDELYMDSGDSNGVGRKSIDDKEEDVYFPCFLCCGCEGGSHFSLVTY